MKKLIILAKQKDSNNEVIVYVESTTYENGKRKRTRKNTGVKVNPVNWSKTKFKVLSGDKLHEEKNSSISIFFDFLNKPKKLEETLLTDTPKSLTVYFQNYIDYRKSIGSKRGSYKEFITLKNRLERFEKSKGIKLFFDDINLMFSDAFIIWHSEQKFNPNTIHKSFVILKTFLYHYFERQDDYNIKISTAFQNPKFGKVQTHLSPPLPLTSKEFETLIKFSSMPSKFLKGKKKKVGDRLMNYNERLLIKACDAFIFGCATGLRHSDLYRTNGQNVKNNIIYIEPIKTENTKKENLCKIPLNQYSQNILNKYGYDLSLIKLTNQYYNNNLKDLFEVLEFNDKILIKEYNGMGEPEEVEYFKWQKLTSHNARDTFITFAIKVGIDIPSIMDMTGHTKYETMKRYIKLDDNHLIESMDKFNVLNITKDKKPRHKKEGQFIKDEHKKFLEARENKTSNKLTKQQQLDKLLKEKIQRDYDKLVKEQTKK